MTPRRFCFVTTFYPPAGFGGDAIAVRAIAQALARRGCEVTVVHNADAYAALGGGRAVAVEPDASGVRVVTLRSRLPVLTTLLLQQAGRPVAHARRLRRLLDEGGFDVIVFNNVSLMGGPGVLACGRDAARLYVAHEHWLVCPTHVLWRHNRERCTGRECVRCQLHYRRPPQLWRQTGSLDRHLSQIDTFVALSEFSRAKHREFGFAHEMIVLPLFVPEPEPVAPGRPDPSPHTRPYFLFVGRLERIKGLDDVIDAFAGRDAADLLVIGEGTHGEALRRRARGNPRVRFVGRVPHDQLGPYYRHATALLSPSVGFETFGLTLIEGFSHGTPAIARRVGPLEEIVEKSGGGILFNTPGELHSALRALEGDAARRDALGRSGHDAFLARWSERAVIPRFIDLAEQAWERRKRGRA